MKAQSAPIKKLIPKRGRRLNPSEVVVGAYEHLLPLFACSASRAAQSSLTGR
jgi:hypothetical protein